MPDRQVNYIITGDPASAVAAFETASAAARGAAADTTGLGTAAKTAGSDTKLAMEDAAGSTGLIGAGARGAASDVESLATRSEASGSRIGSVFDKIGTKLEGLGIPFASVFTTAGQKMDETATHSSSLMGSLQNLGKTTLMLGSVAFVGAGIEALHLADDMDQATNRIAASAGISQQAAKAIGAAFDTTGGQFTFTGTQMAQAYAEVAGQLGHMQGHALSASQALTVETTAATLAEASQSDLGTTTSALSAVMMSYGLSVNQAASASDVLYNISRITNTPIAQLATVMDRLKGRLGVLAPSLKDVGTLMAFPSVAAQGSRGAMIVNTALQTLLGNSKATDAQLSAMNVHLFDAQGKFVGLKSVVEQMGPALAGMSQQQQIAAEKTLFGASAAQLMGGIVLGGAAAYDKSAAAVSRAGSAQDAAAKATGNLDAEGKKLKAAVHDLGTQFGEALMPKLEDVVHWTEEGVTWFEHHKEVAEALAGVIGGVLAVAVGAFTVNKLAGMVKGMQQAFTTVGNLATKMLGLGTASITTGTEVATTGTAATVAGTEVEGMGVAAVTTSAEVEGLGVAAVTTSAEVDTLVASETAADVAGVGLAGVLGPLAIAVAAVGGAVWIASKFVDNGVQSFKNYIAPAEALKSSTLPDLNAKINALKGDMDKLTGSVDANTLAWVKAHDPALATQFSNVDTQIKNLQGDTATLTGNAQILANQFGLNTSSAELLAQSLGINLTHALTPAAWQTFQTAVQNAGGATALMQTQSQALSTRITTDMQIIAQASQTGGAGMVSAIQSAITDLQGLNAYAPGFGLGQAVSQGINDGIASEAAAAAQAAVNVVWGALGAAKSALGIHSPSTVFADQVGVPIVQGIIGGAQSQQGALHATMSSLTGGLPGVAASAALASAANAASSPSGSSAPVPIEVHIHTELDGQEMSHTIRTLLLRQKRGTPMLGLS